MRGPRRRWVRLSLLAVALVVALLAGCGGGDHGGGVRFRPVAPAHTSKWPEWRAPNADLANTRRLDGAIDATNVKSLRRAWAVPIRAAYAATPVVAGGIAYTADLMSNVYAIDLHSGRVKWRRIFNLPDTGPNGVSFAGGRVFGATPSAAFALDAATGRTLWTTKLIRRYGELIVMTPGYHDRIVYVSTVPARGGVVSTLWAMDASTGRKLWSWEQVPRDSWGDPKVNSGGGMWHPPAFDDRGALYISIANPIPFPGTKAQPWGRSRPGPNKWSNSIIKLDARTGRFIWGTQALPHDLYDWDLECPVILATVDGRRVALTAGKMGFVYAFDAETGRLLWKRSVGLHNGHDDDNLMAMRGDYSNIRTDQRLLPGDQGGVETQMASDGRTVYVPVNNLYAIYQGLEELPALQDLREGTGEIVALDIASGRVTWDHKLPHGMYGGATVTNDLVFTTTYDGTVWALARRSGAVVWKRRLPAGSIAPVGISGDTLLSAGSVPLSADQHMRIVAFRLRGHPDGR